jgi:inner membrane protein
MGEALLGKRIGKKAMALGALGQVLPDIDFVAALWTDPSTNLLTHRGFSHSFAFGFLLAVLMAFIVRIKWKDRVKWHEWFLFFLLEVGIHLFFDLFNTYGVGLFEPFTHARFSWDTIFVADPFFTLPYLIAFIALLFTHKMYRGRKAWWRIGILLSSLYMLYAVINKLNVTSEAKRLLKTEGISYQRVFTTPTPLNNFLWFVTAEDIRGYYIGYCSTLDGKDKTEFHFFPRNDSLLQRVKNRAEVARLIRFSEGYYTVEKWHDTLVFNDLRFGQIIGWHDPSQHFVFHYYLDQPARLNTLVVQRGRFAKWNRESFQSMLERMQGR